MLGLRLSFMVSQSGRGPENHKIYFNFKATWPGSLDRVRQHSDFIGNRNDIYQNTPDLLSLTCDARCSTTVHLSTRDPENPLHLFDQFILILQGLILEIFYSLSWGERTAGFHNNTEILSVKEKSREVFFVTRVFFEMTRRQQGPDIWPMLTLTISLSSLWRNVAMAQLWPRSDQVAACLGWWKLGAEQRKNSSPASKCQNRQHQLCKGRIVH